jgi:hypothetical protein
MLDTLTTLLLKLVSKSVCAAADSSTCPAEVLQGPEEWGVAFVDQHPEASRLPIAELMCEKPA